MFHLVFTKIYWSFKFTGRLISFKIVLPSRPYTEITLLRICFPFNILTQDSYTILFYRLLCPFVCWYMFYIVTFTFTIIMQSITTDEIVLSNFMECILNWGQCILTVFLFDFRQGDGDLASMEFTTSFVNKFLDISSPVFWLLMERLR